MSSIDDLLNIGSDDIGEIKTWINNVISSETSNKELKDLIMKLQFVSQDIEKSLDRLQDQLTQSIPSLKQVLSEISTESISLKEDFIRINRDVHIINERNESVIGNLSRVHSIEKSMNLCVESLSEIHHWETRIKKVNKLFQEREFELISKELNLMKSRVSMLKNNMPTLYSKRNVMVNAFMDKLENMVIPFLNETFEKHDYRSYRYYSQILITIHKFDEINTQYILNRLDAIKQLVQHFSHKNKRLNTLDEWFNDFLLNLLTFFQDEWDWTQQIFNNKQEAIAITSSLIVSICDEIYIELREWISTFIETSQHKALKMSKMITLFQIFANFFVSIHNSRLLNNNEYCNDVLDIMPNITKLISNLLRTIYKTSYLNMEQYMIFCVFSESPIVMNNQVSMAMPTLIRWIQENKLNELSFTDIHQRMEDSIAAVTETLHMSHKRCIVMSKGSLIKDIVALYDAFIVEYINHLDELLTRCCYDSSKMISPFNIQKETEDDASNSNGNEDNVMKANGNDHAKSNNWIMDLKQAFTLKTRMNSMEQRITLCIDEILSSLVTSIDKLCDMDHNDVSVQFYRIFLSNAELKLLSKYSNMEEAKQLFVKSLSLANGVSIMHKIENRMESILLNIMMQEIKEYIQNIHSLSVWRETPTKSQKMLNLPQFNLQPNECIKKIGSHLLALVQQLETHSTQSTQDEEQDKEDKEDKEEKDEKEDDSEKWLNLVLNETVQTLFMELYKLNGLSLQGTKQLISDLNYLCNVSNAIYLDEPEFIFAILAVLQCKLGNSNTLKDSLTSNTNDNTNNKKTDPKLRTSFQRKVATKFAVLRGLNIRFV